MIYKLLRLIVQRKAAFRALIALSLGMFVLVQLLFRTQLGHLPGLDSRPVLPDERFFYTAPELVAFLDSLGSAGRVIYWRLHLVDMVFPLVYGLLLATLVVYVSGDRGGRPVAVLATLPFVATLADLVENVCVRIVSTQFAAGRSAAEVFALAPWVASLAGVATATKWTAATLSLLLILLLSLVPRLRPAQLRRE